MRPRLILPGRAPGIISRRGLISGAAALAAAAALPTDPAEAGFLLNPYQFAPASPPPPTDPHLANVVLLISGEGADGSTTFTDESPLGQTVTVFGAAQVDTADSKFGGGALLCNTAGTDYIQVPDNAGFAYGAGDFTEELWWQPLFVSNHYIMGQGSAGGFAWSVLAIESNSQRYLQRDNGAVDIFETTNTFPQTANQWYHLVVERSGTIFRLYRDGSMVKKVTFGTTAMTNATDPFRIGLGWPGVGTKARMNEIRVTKGVARYNSDSGYTVPTAPFPRS